MSDLERCSWKMVDPGKFVMGISADRCGAIADVVVLRPNRKTDLFLCEEHVNEFIAHWGLHNQVEILCRCEDDPNAMNGIDWDDIEPAPLVADPHLMTTFISSSSKPPKKGERKCEDVDCKKCLQDEPKTWWHR